MAEATVVKFCTCVVYIKR